MDEQAEQRRKKVQKLRERGLNPYANDFCPSHLSAEVLAAHQGQSDPELEACPTRYRIAGRVMALRSFGKAAFIKVADRAGLLQAYLARDLLGEEYEVFRECADVGDIVGVEGPVMRTRTGELSIKASRFRILTKNIRPLPEKWHGLADVEIRYRQRYLDLVANPEVRRTFELRARLVAGIRRFLDERGYLEVETPMMHTLAGGATARPFVTHHNALGLDLYLRVAPELFLKRLLVGGLERVYEINRNFRNEGISTQHNPEFTMLEFYQAYATYRDLMDLTEEMFGRLADELKGARRISYQGRELSLEAPFRRASVQELVAEAFAVEAGSLDDPERLRALAREHRISVDSAWGAGRLLMTLFEERVEKTLWQPTFVCDFPLEVSPLSRRKEDRPELVDRFELYVAGRELCNAFSELNDPDDQRQRFVEQMKQKARGDEEAMPHDEDYIRALEVGMPPAAGEGIGIDRLVMLFADAPSIRDVILFPLLRPES